MKTFYREFATLMNFLYWLPMFISVAVAIALSTVVIWWDGNYFKIKKIYKIIANIIAVALAIFIIPLHWTVPVKKEEQKAIAEYNERKEKYEAAKAVFDEQCKKAGEKIYRTVDNVDGIMLLKVWWENDTEDFTILSNEPMWEYAALTQIGGKNYIDNFLDNLQSNGIHGNVWKYQYVDVKTKNDNQIIKRFTRKEDKQKNGELNIEENPVNPARYAVTYETDVDPELRKHWVAGVTIKIIDQKTNELLAEKIVYSRALSIGKRKQGGAWRRTETCPDYKEIDEPISIFVRTVLKPQILEY